MRTRYTLKELKEMFHEKYPNGDYWNDSERKGRRIVNFNGEGTKCYSYTGALNQILIRVLKLENVICVNEKDKNGNDDYNEAYCYNKTEEEMIELNKEYDDLIKSCRND